ncbi:MAG: Uma2 family endonuclease [Verrucomicrobiota bacterium]
MVQRHQVTVEEYYRLGESGAWGHQPRVELIEGEIVEMSPIGSKHAAVVDLLIKQFTSKTESLYIRCQHPIRLSESSEPEPDIALVRGEARDYVDAHPTADDVLLLVEVADTTLPYDLETKSPLYARHGIPEYWVVDTEARQVHVFRRPQEGTYLVRETLTATDALDLPETPGGRMELGEILL